MDLKELLGEGLYKEAEAKLAGRTLIVDDGKLIPKHRFDCINLSLKEHKLKVQALDKEKAALAAELTRAWAQVNRARRLEQENLALAKLLVELLPYRLKDETEETKNE